MYLESSSDLSLRRPKEAVFEIDVNPITPSPEPIMLEAVSLGPANGFGIELDTDRIALKNAGKTITCRITAPMGAPEKTVASFKVIGRRNNETEELALKVTVLSAQPHVKLGYSDTQVYDQPEKISFGETISRIFRGTILRR